MGPSPSLPFRHSSVHSFFGEKSIVPNSCFIARRRLPVPNTIQPPPPIRSLETSSAMESELPVNGSIEQASGTSNFNVKAGLARMLKGGVIMDVVNAEQVSYILPIHLCQPTMSYYPQYLYEIISNISTSGSHCRGSWRRCRYGP